MMGEKRLITGVYFDAPLYARVPYIDSRLQCNIELRDLRTE